MSERVPNSPRSRPQVTPRKRDSMVRSALSPSSSPAVLGLALETGQVARGRLEGVIGVDKPLIASRTPQDCCAQRRPWIRRSQPDPWSHPEWLLQPGCSGCDVDTIDGQGCILRQRPFASCHIVVAPSGVASEKFKFHCHQYRAIKTDRRDLRLGTRIVGREH